VIMLGDNIYGSKSPSELQKKFEIPYKPLLDAGVQFYAALGNHDDTNERFYKFFNMNGQQYYSFKKGNVQFFVLDSNYMDPKQLAWLEKELGGWIPGASGIAEVRGKWLCIPHWFIRYPFIINRGYFNKAGVDYNDKTTWNDLLAAGAKLKKAGYPFGIPISQTPDSNDNLYPLMLAFKAHMFDPAGNVAFARKEIQEVLRFGERLFKETMTDEVLSWDDTSNNRFIASGKGALVCNPISAYRTAAKDNPDVFQNLEIQKPPLGPSGVRIAGARTMSYGVFNFSKVQDLGKEFLYVLNRESLKGMEASTGYNHPFLKALLKKPMPVIGHEPKLMLEQDFTDWVKFIGYPGPMTKTATGMYAKFIIPTMFAEVCNGKAPRTAMEEAETKLRAV